MIGNGIIQASGARYPPTLRLTHIHYRGERPTTAEQPPATRLSKGGVMKEGEEHTLEVQVMKGRKADKSNEKGKGREIGVTRGRQ